MKVYDCFTFFEELELLEIRLNVLDEVVDHFVIVEATRTFSNRPKPLHYAENKDRFSAFSSKIIHVVVDDYPEFETAWTYENHQRNCIERGLTQCRDDDVIMISDIDEIPRPELVLRYKDDPGIKVFEQWTYVYYLNALSIREPIQWGTKMLSYRDFRHALDDVHNYGACNIKKLNQGTTANKIRTYTGARRILQGGWHFTFLGGIEAIRTKIQAYSHQERNYAQYTDPRRVEQRMERAFKSHRLVGFELDDRFPAYLVKNRERYAHLLGPVTPEKTARRALKYAKLMAFRDRAAEVLLKTLTAVIPVKKWRKQTRKFLGDRLFGQGW